MTRLDWASAPRRYESGVDHGVLYPSEGPGVPWNGLVTVDESHTGGDMASYYFDGIKYLEKQNPKNFQATITAFSAPKEFSQCIGELPVIPGFILTRQPRKQFGFSYRTLIEDGDEYKIHVVYNATASPESRGYSTIDGSAFATSFSWKIDAVPPKVSGFRPSAHFVLDSTKTDLFTLRAIEDILYGTSTSEPRLPSVEELVDIVGLWEPKLLTYDFYEPVILESNPSGYWRLDEPTGALVAIDSSGHENHLNFTGGFSEPGALVKSDNGAWNGATSQAEMIDLGVLNGFAMECWASDTWPTAGWSAPLWGRAGDLLNNDATSSPNLYFNTTTRMIEGWTWNQSTENWTNVYGPIAEPGLWYHIALVVEEDLRTVNFYVDAELVDTAVRPQDFVWNGPQAFSIGSVGRCSVDEAAIYNHPLSKEEVRKRFSVGKAAFAKLTSGLGDLTPSKVPGIYRDLPTTRLAETAVGGLYRLE